MSISIYLDHAATTRVCPEAADAVYRSMTEGYGNPSSRHALGASAAQRLKEDRQTVAGALGCRPGEIAFTSGGTEGDNWAFTIALAHGRRQGKHIITTAIEHAAVLEPAKRLAQQGYEVTYLSPDREGRIPLSALEAALRPDTIFVSMMLVNNELGTIQPVKQAAQLLKARGSAALLHTDAVQAFLKIPFTPKELGVDLLTVSGHKIRAPKGIGALYIREGLKPQPLLLGGGQEDGLRPGTEPTPLVAGLAAACSAWDPAASEQMSLLKTYALATLARVPNLEIISPGDAPHIFAISLPGYPSEMLVRALSDRGIYVSSGSACHRGKPSHVFASLDLPKRTLTGVLRISLSPENTKAHIDALAEELESITRQRVCVK